MVDRGSFSKSDLTFVDDRVRAFIPFENGALLPVDFEPDEWSVVCGRGKECFNHVGNRRFRVFCEIHLEKYSAAKTKFEKSLIVMSIVDAVRENSQGGFIKQDPDSKRWYEVGDAYAREKVGQQLRECLARQSPTRFEARKYQRKSISKRRSSSTTQSTAESRRSSTSSSNSIISEHSDQSRSSNETCFCTESTSLSHDSYSDGDASRYTHLSRRTQCHCPKENVQPVHDFEPEGFFEREFFPVPLDLQNQISQFSLI